LQGQYSKIDLMRHAVLVSFLNTAASKLCDTLCCCWLTQTQKGVDVDVWGNTEEGLFKGSTISQSLRRSSLHVLRSSFY